VLTSIATADRQENDAKAVHGEGCWFRHIGYVAIVDDDASFSLIE
jgi:hypothetical protein